MRPVVGSGALGVTRDEVNEIRDIRFAVYLAIMLHV